MKPISFVRSLILGAAMSLPLGAQAVDGRVVRQQRDSAGVARAAQAFLVAFDSLRWEPFAAAWGPEATVFLPDAARPNLIKGRDEILRYFRGFFDDVRSSATSGSATLGIIPAVRGLRIVLADSAVALVTFELGDGAVPGRRTLVWLWNETNGKWLLTHLHASRLRTS